MKCQSLCAAAATKRRAWWEGAQQTAPVGQGQAHGAREGVAVVIPELQNALAVGMEVRLAAAREQQLGPARGE